ncbi:unnamed protein product [Leuciscus chuanchicus]
MGPKPFQRHFEHIIAEAPVHDEGEPNEYHSATFMPSLVKYFLPQAPLWSALMLGHVLTPADELLTTTPEKSLEGELWMAVEACATSLKETTVDTLTPKGCDTKYDAVLHLLDVGPLQNQHHLKMRSNMNRGPRWHGKNPTEKLPPDPQSQCHYLHSAPPTLAQQ